MKQRPLKPIEERFWPKVHKTETCWEWTAGKYPNGYGQLSRGRYGEGNIQAHRVSYELAYGPIPEGQVIDHICHVKACVNPEHLRLATTKQNMENQRNLLKNNKSGVRGVRWEAHRNKWAAAVLHHGKKYHVGRFHTLAEAEAAVIAKRNELFTHNDADRRAA